MTTQLSDGTAARIAQMRDAFEQRLLTAWPTAVVNGDRHHRLPTTCSIALPELVAAEMLILLDQGGVCCSAGSACHSASVHPSHVLEAMGHSAQHAASTLRFSFCRFNTQAEVLAAAEQVLNVARKLQQLKGDPGSLVELHG
jgi:cysteine desulfurase